MIFKKADGLTFKPIENNNNSTPIFDGNSNKPLTSEKLKCLNKKPENIKPIKTGKDNSLKTCPQIRAPAIQIKNNSIYISILNCTQIYITTLICLVFLLNRHF